MYCIRPVLASLFLIINFPAFSQLTPTKEFEDITAASFVLPDSPMFKNAGAVYLIDVGTTEYVSQTTGKFTVEYNRHCRIKINNQSGFDAASFTIPLFFDGSIKEVIPELKAITYNLENGIVTGTELHPSQVFYNKVTKYYTQVKFSLPVVKEGSLLDVFFHVSSAFNGEIPTWYFQGEYPRVHSEYRVMVSDQFSFNVIRQSLHPFYTDTLYKVPYTYKDEQNTGINSKFLVHHWVMKNVPPLKEEPFTSSLKNYWSKVNFYFNYFNNSAGPLGSFSVWGEMTQRLLEADRFGGLLYLKNKWIDHLLENLLMGAVSETEKAKRIYRYVRDNYNCTGYYAVQLSEDDLQSVVKNKQGTVADINLLLVALLAHAGINASPVILSTVSNGKVSQFSAVLERFNRTIAACRADGKVVYLDASNKYMPFGILSREDYNGFARIIRGNSLAVNLGADSTREFQKTSITIGNTPTGGWKGEYKMQLGIYGSETMRRAIDKNGEDQELKAVQMRGEGIEIGKPVIENLNNQDEPLRISMSINGLSEGKDQMVYISPIPKGLYSNISLRSDNRLYPVELPFASDENYDCDIAIPPGYVIEDIPETYQVLLNGGDGLFEYLVTRNSDKITIHTRIVFHKTFYKPEVYADLREFIADISKKLNQQIVLRKEN